MDELFGELHQQDEDQRRQEYETRKFIWHFTFPRWVKFDNLHGFVTMYPRYWWMTREQMDWFYDKFFKNHKDVKHFSKPFIKYSDPIEVENCKGGIDRNIISPLMSEGSKIKEEKRYLKSSYR